MLCFYYKYYIQGEKTMNKRFVVSILLCITLIVSMCACGTSNVKMEGEYASQEKFLEDMTVGITNRLKNSNDGKERTDEELYALYEDLVAYELEQIEKYEDQVFADALFNDLAHAYIDACQMQRIMAENYKINNLTELWSSARTIRCAIITEFYERYNLPISSEQAAEYSVQTSGNSQSSVTLDMDGELDISSGLTMYYDDMVTYDPIEIKKAKGQTLFENDDIHITLKSLELENGRYTINMTMKNSLKSDRITCCLGGGSIDNYQITMYHPWGYYWANAGKINDTYSDFTTEDLEDIGKANFKTVTAYLYVITSDGSTGQYIAKIPLTIDRSAFES
jgi:hypothetical protein